MSERYARQIRREYRRTIRRAVAIVKAQVASMKLPARVRLAFNIVFKKKFD